MWLHLVADSINKKGSSSKQILAFYVINLRFSRKFKWDRRNNLVGECKSLSKLTEHQFTHPVCSLKLPAITNNVWKESVGDDRQVLLKKNVIERMNRDHKEIKNNGLKSMEKQEKRNTAQ